MSCPCAHGERFLPSRLLAVFFHSGTASVALTSAMS